MTTITIGRAITVEKEIKERAITVEKEIKERAISIQGEIEIILR